MVTFTSSAKPEDWQFADTGTHIIAQFGNQLSDGLVFINKEQVKLNRWNGYKVNPTTGQVMFPPPAGVGYDQWMKTGPQVFVSLEDAAPTPTDPLPSLPPYDVEPDPEDQRPQPPEPSPPPVEPQPPHACYAFVRTYAGIERWSTVSGAWRLDATSHPSLWKAAPTYGSDFLPSCAQA